MMARALSDLTAGLASVPPGLMVSDVTLDSHAVKPGALFLACRGQKHHGLDFADAVVAQGARAVLYEIAGDASGSPTGAKGSVGAGATVGAGAAGGPPGVAARTADAAVEQAAARAST